MVDMGSLPLIYGKLAPVPGGLRLGEPSVNADGVMYRARERKSRRPARPAARPVQAMAFLPPAHYTRLCCQRPGENKARRLFNRR